MKLGGISQYVEMSIDLLTQKHNAVEVVQADRGYPTKSFVL